MITKTALAAVALALTTAHVPAAAEEPAMVMPLPCTGVDYLVQPASQPRADVTHEVESVHRYHENSVFIIEIEAVPVDPGHPGYVGRLEFRHMANDGPLGGGHAVSSFGMRARLTGTDDSVIQAQEVAHISATARPDLDPDAFIRVFFARARCLVR